MYFFFFFNIKVISIRYNSEWFSCFVNRFWLFNRFVKIKEYKKVRGWRGFINVVEICDASRIIKGVINHLKGKFRKDPILNYLTFLPVKTETRLILSLVREFRRYFSLLFATSCPVKFNKLKVSSVSHQRATFLLSLRENFISKLGSKYEGMIPKRQLTLSLSFFKCNKME